MTGVQTCALPILLKLSAFAARELNAAGYAAKLQVDLAMTGSIARTAAMLQDFKGRNAKKPLAGDLPVALPRRFAQRLIEHAKLDAKENWANLSHDALQRLAQALAAGEYQVDGKGVFKEEFVTAGGVDLKEVDFRTMQSKRCKGLFFAGEILDVDGITGGFNFQNAWTTGYIAGMSVGD